MLVGRRIFIVLLAVGTLLVGAAGGAGRVICYGSDGHVAVEGPLNRDACCDHGEVPHDQPAASVVCQADCTDIVLTGAGQYASRHTTTQVRPTMTPDWGSPVATAVTSAHPLECSLIDACHSPPDGFTDLASLQVVVLLI